MIFLDPNVISEILWGKEDAGELALYLDVEQSKGSKIIVTEACLISCFPGILHPSLKPGDKLILSIMQKATGFNVSPEVLSMSEPVMAITGDLILSGFQKAPYLAHIFACAKVHDGEVLTNNPAIMEIYGEQLKRRKLTANYSAFRWK